MTDPYIQINGTKIEVFDNDLGAVRTLKQLSDGTYVTNVATGAEVKTGTNNTKIVTPNAIGDADAWSANSAPIFDVATYDNGSGLQPTTTECRFKTSKNQCTVHYKGNGVKAGTNNYIVLTLSSFPTPANVAGNTVVGSVLANVSTTANIGIIAYTSTTDFVVYVNDNIADNATINVFSFTMTYEI